jgi:hypothetical protein
MDLLLHAPDDRHRLAKIRLRVTRRMGKRHENLTFAPFPLPDIGLHDRVAAGEAMLIPQPVKYPLRLMMLLGQHLLVALKPGVNDRDERIQLRPLDRCRAPVARRNRKCQRLVGGVARDVEMTCYRTLAHPVSTRQTNLPVKFHGVDLRALPPDTGKAKWTDLAPPAAGQSRRHRGLIFHRRSQMSFLSVSRRIPKGRPESTPGFTLN